LETIEELLKYDYLLNNHRYGLPVGLNTHNPTNINDITYSYTKNRKFVEDHINTLINKTPREIKKLVHIEYFSVSPITYTKTELPLMFVYDPIKQKAAKIINLTKNLAEIKQ
jgi:tetrahydromethanopterin S-methyltransferase subunit H